MKKILIPIIALLITGCGKGSNKAQNPVMVKRGYDHTTPQGILLSKLAQGSNKKLTFITTVYYNSASTVLYSNKIGGPTNTYLLWDDGFTVNPTYLAGATTSGDSPIVNNSSSQVHIDNGVNYLYYQPDIHQSPDTSPSTVIKVAFTLSTDLKTFDMFFKNNTSGSLKVGAITYNYSYSIKDYTYISL